MTACGQLDDTGLDQTHHQIDRQVLEEEIQMQIGNKMVAGLASVTVALGGLAGSALTPAKQTPGTDTLRTAGNSGLRMNQIQQIGSHNSYHRELSPAEQAGAASS